MITTDREQRGSVGDLKLYRNSRRSLLPYFLPFLPFLEKAKDPMGRNKEQDSDKSIFTSCLNANHPGILAGAGGGTGNQIYQKELIVIARDPHICQMRHQTSPDLFSFFKVQQGSDGVLPNFRFQPKPKPNSSYIGIHNMQNLLALSNRPGVGREKKVPAAKSSGKSFCCGEEKSGCNFSSRAENSPCAGPIQKDLGDLKPYLNCVPEYYLSKRTQTPGSYPLFEKD